MMGGQFDHLLIVVGLDLASALQELVQILEHLELEIVLVAQALVLLDQHGLGEAHKTLLAGRLWRIFIFDTHRRFTLCACKGLGRVEEANQ